MQCPKCQTILPADARFCIECGYQTTRPVTGATVQLADPNANLRICPHCAAANPSHAAFCVMCGNSVEGEIRSLATSRGPTHRPVQQPHSTSTTCMSSPWARSKGGIGSFIPVVFFVGLAFLFFTRSFFPGILLLLGVIALLSAINDGKPKAGLIGAVWLMGLAILFFSGAFFPGILILVGLRILLVRVLT